MTLEERLKLADSINRHLIDPQETSATCVRSVQTLIQAFTWSAETEDLCVEQMKPIAEKMHQLAVEFKEFMGRYDPPA